VTAMDFPVELDKPELNQQYSTVLKFGVEGNHCEKESCGEDHSATNCMYVRLWGDMLMVAMSY